VTDANAGRADATIGTVVNAESALRRFLGCMTSLMPPRGQAPTRPARAPADTSCAVALVYPARPLGRTRFVTSGIGVSQTGRALRLNALRYGRATEPRRGSRVRQPVRVATVRTQPAVRLVPGLTSSGDPLIRTQSNRGVGAIRLGSARLRPGRSRSPPEMSCVSDVVRPAGPYRLGHGPRRSRRRQ
jgi:hypothetical protein